MNFVKTDTTDPFAMTIEEMDYRVSCCTDAQRQILALLVRGESDRQAAAILHMDIATARSRIYSARDRAGLCKRWELVTMYAIWQYAQRHIEHSGKVADFVTPLS